MIDITEILGFDTIAGSRIILNQNFSKLKDSINTILSYVDTDSKTITGIKSLNVSKGDSSSTSEILIETNGSAHFGGNIKADGVITGSSIALSGGLSIAGSFTLSNASNSFINKGDTYLNKSFILGDFNSNFIDASYQTTFKNSSLIYNNSSAYAGIISLVGRSICPISWESYALSSPNNLHHIKLDTGSIGDKPVVGQIIKLIVKINEQISLAKYGAEPEGYWILKDGLEYTSSNPISYGIKFTHSYQSCELCFNGINWVILNTYGAEIV